MPDETGRPYSKEEFLKLPIGHRFDWKGKRWEIGNVYRGAAAQFLTETQWGIVKEVEADR